MLYYSTNKTSPAVSFREATINGQAPDGGLYFPEHIPVVDTELISNIRNYSNAEIAYRVIAPYVGEDIPEVVLRQIVKETVDFEIPLVKVNERMASLELFHGPTLAFKDIGARFMSRCLGYFLKDETRKVTVLVATSGDTGGAVAHGFYEVPGVEVVILYPSGKVSPVQEKQLTTLGKNISALEVQGTFDDCQQMVKTAFKDTELPAKRFLTSANSINVARWLPQQFYYFFAYKQCVESGSTPVICVPSGNFGNICAGMLAHVSGLPVAHFIAACNANDTVTQYLETGKMPVQKAVATISNAMDVADPSNFIRILEIFKHDFPALKEKLSSYRISDAETRSAIKKVYNEHHYMLDPHGAVAYLALERYLDAHPGGRGIFLETAHPVKFPDAVEAEIGHTIPVPAILSHLFLQEKKSIVIPADYSRLKEYLLS